MTYPTFEELTANIKPKWYYKLWPIQINKNIRLFTFVLYDCSYSVKPMTKLHLFDLLELNHRKWWMPKYIGFQIWY